MELLLNAIWLALATGLLLVWRLRWLPQLRECSSGRRKWQSFAGLVCVLALLFPAISLTDDLHPTEFALADTKSLYCVSVHGQLSTGPTPGHHSPTQDLSGVILASQLRLTLFPADSSLTCSRTLVFTDSCCPRISGRAPPAIS